MGQFDYDKIQNVAIREFAKTFDKDGVKGLSEEELTLFKAAAETNDDITKADYKEILGYSTNPIAPSDAAKGEEPAEDVTKYMTSKQAEKWNKEGNEAHIDELKYYVKEGGSRAAFLAEKNLSPTFKAEVQTVMALMPAEYASTEEVGKKHKEIEKKCTTDFQKKILKELENMAKNECAAKALANIEDLYKKQDETLTPEQRMANIKENAENKKEFKGDFKNAFKAFEQRLIAAASQDALAQVGLVDDADKTKGKQVIKEAKKHLDDDKYTKTAIDGDRNIFKRALNWAKGRKTIVKDAAEIQGRKNNVKKHVVQSHTEVAKALGNKMDKFYKLHDAKIVTMDKNGNWDLSKLSELIGNQIGTDYRLNREHKKDELVAEIANVQSKLEAIQGLSEFSEDEAKALVKLCGYDIEGKNAARAIFGGLAGAVAGAAVGLGAAKGAEATLPHEFKRGGAEYALDPIEIKTDLDMSKVNNATYPDGVSVNASGNIVLNIAMLIKDGTSIIDCSTLLGEMALRTALPVALVGAALGTLEGLKDKGQEPVLSVGFEEQTYEDYCRMLEAGPNKEYAAIGKMIAGSFVVDGKWDREGYKDFLNRAAGNHNTLLNRDELIGALLERQKELQKQGTTPVNTTPTTPINPNGEEEHSYATKDEHTPVYTDVPTIDGTKTGWRQIAGQYDCLINTYGPAKAIRIIKIAQAINNGDYSKENIERLLELSLKGRQYMRNVEGIDYRVYINALDATYLGKDVKVPVSLAGCDRDDSKSLKVNGARRGNGNQTVVAPTGSAADKIESGKTSEYFARFDEGAAQSYQDNVTARDQAVNDFTTKNPNAKKEEWEQE